MLYGHYEKFEHVVVVGLGLFRFYTCEDCQPAYSCATVCCAILILFVCSNVM